MARRRGRGAPPSITVDDGHEDLSQSVDQDGTLICPLCERPIPGGARSSRHHLTPRLKGGARLGTVRLHQICHSTVHALFSETELARRLMTVEALRAEPALAGFLAWVRTKPGDFHAPTATTGERRLGRDAARRRTR